MTTATGQTALLEEVQLTAKRIFDLISPELTLVEEEFERQARSNIQVIAYIGERRHRRAGAGARASNRICGSRARRA
jgi:hypothetical protein